MRGLAGSAGADRTLQMLRMVMAQREAGPEFLAYAASLLAAGQEPEQLGAAFASHAPHEFLACLSQELVLRGVDVTALKGGAAWARRFQGGDHPLAWLPLTAAEFECHPDLPSYSARGGMSYALPYGRPTGPELGRAPHAELPAVREITTAAEAEDMSAAVATWVAQSNGRFEARVFTGDAPFEDSALPEVVPLLGLDCQDPLTVGERVAVVRTTAEHAWRVLFNAASLGGAYNAGLRGGYGRLASWRSLAALAGVPVGADPQEVRARVQGCAWFALVPDTDWFEQVAWDFALVALTADRRRLAVLAATDTD